MEEKLIPAKRINNHIAYYDISVGKTYKFIPHTHNNVQDVFEFLFLYPKEFVSVVLSHNNTKNKKKQFIIFPGGKQQIVDINSYYFNINWYDVYQVGE